ncbi:MAG: ROK family protein [Raoultibacter sp.]
MHTTDTLFLPPSVIALDVGGTKIAGALITYDAGVKPYARHYTTVPTHAQRGGAAVLETLVDLVEKLLAHAEAEAAPLSGIGVATAGCVENNTGAIAYANDLMPGWTGQPVGERLREAFGLPVAVMNDVQAHALGEARWGAARKTQSCLMIAVGTGLGGAFVEDGRVLRGFHGAAGEVGHTLHPAARDIMCTCGHKGHIESITAGTGIGELYQRRYLAAAAGGALCCEASAAVGKADAGAEDASTTSIDGAEVARRAAAGDALACTTLQDAGCALGEALGSWANMLDPEVIILSGSVCAAGPLWREAVTKGFASQALAPLQKTPLIPADLGGVAPLVGAAENLRDTLVCTRGTL